MDGDELWSGNLGMEGERNGKNTRKVSKVDIRFEGENAGIFGERGNAEREIEGENWGKSGKIRGKASKRGG